MESLDEDILSTVSDAAKDSWHIELYHSAGHSEYAGVREGVEVGWGRMAGIEEDIEVGDIEDEDTELEVGDKEMAGRGNGHDPNKMIGVDDRRAEEDTAEAEAAAMREVVDIFPMEEALLEVDPAVDNSSLQIYQ